MGAPALAREISRALTASVSLEWLLIAPEKEHDQRDQSDIASDHRDRDEREAHLPLSAMNKGEEQRRHDQEEKDQELELLSSLGVGAIRARRRLAAGMVHEVGVCVVKRFPAREHLKATLKGCPVRPMDARARSRTTKALCPSLR
jgi:hypothetical protein